MNLSTAALPKWHFPPMHTLLTEGDLDWRNGRPPDVAEYGLLRRDGSRELPPDLCLRGHRSRFRWGWEPGYGRTFECSQPGCSSVQYRR